MTDARRARLRAYYQARRARGQCWGCPALSETHTYCFACRLRLSRVAARRYAQRKQTRVRAKLGRAA